MEFDRAQDVFENLEQVCHFQNCHHFPIWLPDALFMHMCISVCAQNRKGMTVSYKGQLLTMKNIVQDPSKKKHL